MIGGIQDEVEGCGDVDIPHISQFLGIIRSATVTREVRGRGLIMKYKFKLNEKIDR